MSLLAKIYAVTCAQQGGALSDIRVRVPAGERGTIVADEQRQLTSGNLPADGNRLL